MPKPTLFLDFDGVIADTLEMNWGVVQELHPEVSWEEYRIDHHMGNVYADPIVPFTEETNKEYFRIYGERLDVSHVADALPAIRQLAKWYRMHIVSSNCEHAIKRVLEDAGVHGCFRHILGREANESKVEKFRHLGRIEGIDLPRVQFLTDTYGDLVEAQRIPLRSLAVTFGYHPRELLEQASPEHLLDSWEAVTEVLL